MANQFTPTSYFRVATAVSHLRVGNIAHNTKQLEQLYTQAVEQGARLVVTPELSLTGYTLGDLIAHKTILTESMHALQKLAMQTDDQTALVVGLPIEFKNKIYNAAAVLAHGRILGIVPKSYLPTYREFYDARWYTSGKDIRQTTLTIGDSDVPFGIDLMFDLGPQAVLGIEICEDLWVATPPSGPLALAGATLIANPSASNELVAKASYRRELVKQQSARTFTGYIYVSSGVNESTTDVVFGGHSLIAEQGSLLAENKRFERTASLTLADIDLDHLAYDRRQATTFKTSSDHAMRVIAADLSPKHIEALLTTPKHNPFVPDNPSTRDERCEEIIAIQAAGLATRLENIGMQKINLGLSGGLDSTLALLVACRAYDQLGIDRKNITAITMPGMATSDRTKSNAVKLAEALGVTLRTIPISDGAKELLKAIKHDQKTQDITYENAQARYRTLILFSYGNKNGGLVLGTGDLSEIALGWATFNGDHISHYNVNASIPKTLVRHLVRWVADQTDFAAAKATLEDILDTPISPELADNQSTEDLLGPYDLHDFFLYHFVRWQSDIAKIQWLAEQAFADTYTTEEIAKWLEVFVTRFFANQWKRSVASDGPKVGSVSLSPRGDWRMPSDIQPDTWVE